MSAYTKLKSRFLMINSSIKICLWSFSSILVRRVLPPVAVFLIYSFFTSSDFSLILKSYSNALVYFVTGLLTILILAFLIILCSAVKSGEQYYFFKKAMGVNPAFTYILRVITLRKSLKALYLYGKLNALKLVWFVYFFLSPAVCIGIIFYLYSYAKLSLPTLVILSFGASLLLSVAFFMWRAAVCRYSAAPYYFFMEENISSSNAIEKSIDSTNGFLQKNVLLEYSFAGWFLSCIALIPVFYVIPYYKMSKAVFMWDEILNRKSA